MYYSSEVVGRLPRRRRRQYFTALTLCQWVQLQGAAWSGWSLVTLVVKQRSYIARLISSQPN